MAYKSHYRSALVLGKFMPLHRGHEALLRFAQQQVDQLYVVVDHLAQETVSGAKRCAWIRETVPAARVVYLPEPMPQQPAEHSDFWNIWCAAILAGLPESPELIIASEQYGETLAQRLGSSFLPFDPARKEVSISASQIRNDIETYWDFLAVAARPDYLMRICIFGPESTGKTTLAAALAAHYRTVWVPEYAREFIAQNGDPTLEDMVTIARGQQTLEATYVPQASRLLFADTDALATSLWSRWLHGECLPELEQLTAQSHHDLYLLTQPDLPWVADEVRYFPNGGAAFYEDSLQLLERMHRPYRVIGGQGSQRLESAIKWVDEAKIGFFQKHRNL